MLARNPFARRRATETRRDSESPLTVTGLAVVAPWPPAGAWPPAAPWPPAAGPVTGAVPPAPDLVQRAEDAFGQGQVLASPLGMALVAATVAHGAPVVPQLVAGRPTQVLSAATDPDGAALEQVRTMMRAVVTEGTATKLNGLGEVRGKTGTAEFTDDGTRAHGWFVGYRGDLAFAVLVVDGGSSEPAVAVAGRFLSAVPS
jgi:cell division protein FtsI/penicillin-binding protein 2